MSSLVLETCSQFVSCIPALRVTSLSFLWVLIDTFEDGLMYRGVTSHIFCIDEIKRHVYNDQNDQDYQQKCAESFLSS